MFKDSITRLPILIFILMFLSLGYTIAHNKVVVIPMGSDDSILRLFNYDAATDRLTIRGTANMPLSEVRFAGAHVRGASQVRQDTTNNAPDIPSNATLVEVEEETISLPSAENLSGQAVVVHAYATFDTQSAVNCPCEFRGYIIQGDGTPLELSSAPTLLEVEAGDDDIDATIQHTYAFIATSQTQNYSFHVQVFAQPGGVPASGFYAVDEAGITITTYGLAGAGVL